MGWNPDKLHAFALTTQKQNLKQTISSNSSHTLTYFIKHVRSIGLFSDRLTIVFTVPKVQFKEGSYKVDESDGEVRAIVYRNGDISIKSTVRCYTRQGSAQVMMDYTERPNTDASVITFLPGEMDPLLV